MPVLTFGCSTTIFHGCFLLGGIYTRKYHVQPCKSVLMSNNHFTSIDFRETFKTLRTKCAREKWRNYSSYYSNGFRQGKLSLFHLVTYESPRMKMAKTSIEMQKRFCRFSRNGFPAEYFVRTVGNTLCPFYSRMLICATLYKSLKYFRICHMLIRRALAKSATRSNCIERWTKMILLLVYLRLGYYRVNSILEHKHTIKIFFMNA